MYSIYLTNDPHNKPSDGVMVRDTWQAEEARAGQRCEGHATDPCQAQPPLPCI
jgi:hypothetical protein